MYFSILDQTSSKAGNCGGIWSFIPSQSQFINQDTGISKSVIVQSPLSRFIIKEDQDANYLHHKRLFAGDGKQDFDLRMLKTDGTVFWAHMAAVAAWDTEGTLVARVVLSDISALRMDTRMSWPSPR